MSIHNSKLWLEEYLVYDNVIVIIKIIHALSSGMPPPLYEGNRQQLCAPGSMALSGGFRHFKMGGHFGAPMAHVICLEAILLH